MRYRATAKKLTTLCARMCVYASRVRVWRYGAETHATISYSHRAVSLRSVLRRRDDKGAGNSLFVPGTMSVHRRLGLILNETSLHRAYKMFRYSLAPPRVNKWKLLLMLAAI